MGAERQQGRAYQLTFEFEGNAETPRHDQGGDDGIRPARLEEPQTPTASDPARALTERLMEEVCRPENLNRAYRRVKANKGAPGADGMTIGELRSWLATHKEELIASLLNGSYRPQLVRGVQIPKPGGGVRQLGIPTVVDRLVQQAILQVLERILDPTFSPSSFGFRPGRGAHDILMGRLSRRVNDVRLLRIIRRFLEAGLMQDGVCVARQEGTPQGGPLSPLLANLLLDDLDKELERRGHYFCRYADDCNIYVRSKVAGERVLASLTRFLEEVLRLRVNREKSAVAFIEERKFLGYRLLSGGRLGIAPKSLDRAKDRVRQITRRNRGVSVGQMVPELNSFLTGWVTYFRLAACKTSLIELDGWLRRKLRCVRLKHCKRTKTLADFFRSHGVTARSSWVTALSGKGWWRLAGSPAANQAMDQRWFESLGLVNLARKYATLQS